MDCKLYLTYRSEYLVLGELCVGVRDRRSSQWLPMHAAVCSRVLGTTGTRDAERLLPTLRARSGERLCLETSPVRLVTGPIVAVEQAGDYVVQHAEEQWRAMFVPRDPQGTRLVLIPNAEQQRPPVPRSRRST